LKKSIAEFRGLRGQPLLPKLKTLEQGPAFILHIIFLTCLLIKIKLANGSPQFPTCLTELLDNDYYTNY